MAPSGQALLSADVISQNADRCGVGQLTGCQQVATRNSAGVPVTLVNTDPFTTAKYRANYITVNRLIAEGNLPK
jgi:hypothetical protein